MEQYVIRGGNPLVGEVEIGGAKNAALAILTAATMTDETVLIENLPDVSDINVLLEAIAEIGATVDRIDRHTARINAATIGDLSVDYEYIKKIDAMGGAVAAIEQGYMQGEMSAHAYEDQRDIETKRSIVVGVNKFVDNKQLAEQDVLTADLSVAERQIAKVEKMKDGRDQKAVDAALTALKQACVGEENLMPYLIDAVKTYATLGEICGVMKEIFGEYRQDGSMF